MKTIETLRTDVSLLAYNLVKEMAHEAASRASIAPEDVGEVAVFQSIALEFGAKVAAAAVLLITAVDLIESQNEVEQ